MLYCGSGIGAMGRGGERRQGEARSDIEQFDCKFSAA